MEEHYKNVFDILKQQDINGCITGSYMLGYFKDWESQQDIDVFT